MPTKEQNKKYRDKNREEINRKSREWYHKNIEQQRERGREGYRKSKDSRKEYYKEYYRNNKEKISKKNSTYIKKNKSVVSEKAKAYYQKNKEQISLKAKEYRKTHRDRITSIKKEWWIQNKYGITFEDYLKIKESQNGCCAICHKPESSFSKQLAVDHNHKTNKIRGLLCHHCNRAIGLLFDDISLFKSAIIYLETTG